MAEAVINIILRWREELADAYERVKRRMQEFSAVRYVPAKKAYDELKKHLWELHEAYAEGAITARDFADRAITTQRRLQTITPVVRGIEAEFKEVGRRVSSVGRFFIRLSWQMGVVGWIFTFHMKRMVTFARQWYTRLRTFVKRVVRIFVDFLKKVAEFPKSLQSAAEALGWLQVTGMLSSVAMQELSSIMAGLVQLGPQVKALFEAWQATLLAVALAIAEGLQPYIQSLVNILFELASSPVLDWLSDLVGAIAGAVVPALQQFVSNLSGLVEALPPVEQLSQSFQRLAETIFSAASSFIEAFLPVIPSIIDVLTSLAETLREHAAELAPAFAEAFEHVGSALEAIIPVLPEITTTLATFTEMCAKLFSVLYDMLGPQILSIMLAFNMLGPVITAVASTIDAFGSIIANLPAIMETVTSGIHMLSGALTFLAANPIALVITAIAAVIAILTTLYFKNEQFRNFVNSCWNAIQNAVSVACTAVITSLQGALNWLQQLIDMVNKVKDAFKKVLDWLKEHICFAHIIGDSVSQAIKHLNNLHATTHKTVQVIRRELRGVSMPAGRVEFAASERRMAAPRYTPININMTFENIVLSEELDFERFLDEVSSRVASAVRGVSA